MLQSANVEKHGYLPSEVDEELMKLERQIMEHGALEERQVLVEQAIW